MTLKSLKISATLLLIFFTSYSIYFATKKPDFIKDSDTNSFEFAYGPSRQGTAYSRLFPTHPTDSTFIETKDLKTANRKTPVIIPRGLVRNKLSGKGDLLAFTTSSSVRLYDLNENKIVSNVTFPKHLTPSNSLGYSEKNNGLYFVLKRHLSPQKKDPRDQSYQTYLARLEIGKDQLELKKMPINQLLKTPHSNFVASPARRIACKTATLINTKITPHQVSVGCSIQTKPKKNWQYGAEKGLHGFVASLILNDDGSLSNNWKFFKTSNIVEGLPYSGYDTGIYNLGSGITLLPDGDLLIGTGNGPQWPKRKQYGCSLIRINPKTHTIRQSGNHSYLIPFQEDFFPYFECWYLNNEYTSTGVGSFKNNKDQVIGVALSKDGYLESFNTDLMYKGRAAVHSLKVGGLSTYGQPIIFDSLSNKALIAYKSSNDRRYLRNKKSIKIVQPGQDCDGFFKKFTDHSPAKNCLYELYSGKTRDDSILIHKGHPLFHQIQSWQNEDLNSDKNSWMIPFLWGGYHQIGPVACLFQRKFSPPKGTQISSLDPLHFTIDHYPSTLNETQLPNDLFWLEVNNKQNCKTLHKKDWVPFRRVLIKSEPSHFSNDTVGGVNINDKGGLEQKWRYSLPQDWSLSRNHVTGIRTKKGGLVVFGAYEAREGPQNTHLFFLDALSGEEVFRTKIGAELHFSMPIVYKDKLIVPTVTQGIKILEFQ